MIKLIAAAVLTGQAATPPSAATCLSRAQIADIGVVASAILVGGARSLCRTHLPADAFLTSAAGEQYAARMRAEGERRADSAVRAFGGAMPGGGEAAVTAMFGVTVRGLLASGPPPEMAAGMADAANCRDLNGVVEAISGMSPEQIGLLASSFASFASRMQERDRARREAAAAAATERDAETDTDPDADRDEEEAAETAPAATRGLFVCPE